MKYIAFLALLLSACAAKAQNAVMSVDYEQPCARADDNAQRIHLQNSGIAKQVAQHLNEEFKTPQTISLKFTCDAEDEGPYYDPQTTEVVVPYAFRAYVIDELQADKYSDNEEDLNMVADDIVLHTLYHEIGHALVDVLDLPITGKEEDAVDELSTLILLESYDNGDEVTISAGDFFDIESLQMDEVSADDLFGEHSLDEQRFFNILCLVYGENPQGRLELFEGMDVSNDRAELCIDTFEKRANAWGNILKPYKQ